MAFASAQISVLTSGATPLIVAGSGTGQFLNVTGAAGDELPGLVENHDPTNPVYLGGPGVTTSNGFKLAAGAALPINAIGTDLTTLYAVATGGTVVVGVLLGRQ